MIVLSNPFEVHNVVFFVIGYIIITIIATDLCVFSGHQQRKEDEYLANRRGKATAEELERIRKERADWDLLNKWE